MTVTYHRQALHAGHQVQDQLHVAREDIVFYNSSPDRVRIEITISNLGLERSRRSELQLQAAPLGAFLPWKNLTTLWCPPLDSGEVVTLTTEVSCSRPRPLGRFDHLAPERLLKALGMLDSGAKDAARVHPHGHLVQRLRQLGHLPVKPDVAAQLPPDPMDLVGQANPHWAGNINVFIGKETVERHRARALRIYPGRVNHAMLIVGEGLRDAYSFELRGDGSAWNSQSSAVTLSPHNAPAGSITAIIPGQWHDVVGMLVVMLQIEPPAGCDRGELEVHVTQKSTGRKALVEFSLDASAQGPGCFTL